MTGSAYEFSEWAQFTSENLNQPLIPTPP